MRLCGNCSFGREIVENDVATPGMPTTRPRRMRATCYLLPPVPILGPGRTDKEAVSIRMIRPLVLLEDPACSGWVSQPGLDDEGNPVTSEEPRLTLSS